MSLSILNDMSLFRYVTVMLYWYGMRICGFRAGKFDEVVCQLDDPMKIQAWLTANITYRKDTKPSDQWLHPQELFDRRAGDCEDFSLFAAYCLHFHHYDSVILCMYDDDSGHATCLIRLEEDRHNTVGTFGGLIHKGTIPEILKDWGYEDWTWYRIKNWDGSKTMKKVENGT